MYLRCKFRNKRELSPLAVGLGVRGPAHGADQRLMIGENFEAPALKHMPEMQDSCVDRQQFAVKRAVAGLSRRQLLRKKTKGPPRLSPPPLLEDGANMGRGSVRHERQLGMWGWVNQ
jgi:hypothetical protein